MDWEYPEDDAHAPFNHLNFVFDADNLFEFGAHAAGPFQPVPFDTTHPSFSQQLYHTAPDDAAVDPMLVSPVSNGEPFDYPAASDASSKLAEERHRHGGRRRARRQVASSKFVPPGLVTGLTDSSRLVHGQITPPSSDTNSPPQPPLDTVDPSAVMPMSDSSKLDIDGLDVEAETQFFFSSPPSASTDVLDACSPYAKPAALAAPAAIAAPALIPADPPVKPKSKRGRKKKILAPAARDAQRVRTLARNRAAAQRCRQRKKAEHAQLETKARSLTKERTRLTILVGSLRDELLSLKGMMLSHAGCTEMDGNVARYVREQRDMLMSGTPIDNMSPNLQEILDKASSEEFGPDAFDEDDQDEDDQDEDDQDEDDQDDQDDFGIEVSEGDGEADDEPDISHSHTPSQRARPPPPAAAVAHRTRSHRKE